MQIPRCLKAAVLEERMACVPHMSRIVKLCSLLPQRIHNAQLFEIYSQQRTDWDERMVNTEMQVEVAVR